MRPPRHPPVEHFAVLRTTPASSTFHTCALRKSKIRVLLNAQKVKHAFQKCANAVLLSVLLWGAFAHSFVASLFRCSDVPLFAHSALVQRLTLQFGQSAIKQSAFVHSLIRLFVHSENCRCKPLGGLGTALLPVKSL